MDSRTNVEMWRMEAKDDVLTLDIYDRVEGDSVNFWTGEKEASETSAKHFKAELEAHPDVKEIRININSAGGSVFEGMAIYSQLKRHKAHKTVIVDGFACSIASVIAMAGDTVIMPETAVMMIHNPWTVAVGNATALRKEADDLDKLGESMRKAYLAKAGDKLNEGKLVEMLNAETYLTAAECIELGLADAYEEEKPEEPEESKEKAEARAKVEKARAEQAQAAIEKEMNRRREMAQAVVEKYIK
jgi:ATP-dependent Clp endopeptidase proteolytic subunit ClpP